MIEKGRKTKFAILATVAILFGFGAVAPVFAWHDSNFSTKITYGATSATDTATITLSDNGPNYGSVTFNVYAAAVGATCAPTGPSLLTSVVAVAGHTDHGSDQTYQTTSAAFPYSGHTGNYVWIVSYGGGGYPSMGPLCESMPSSSFPPPPTVPEFPLGMAMLLALAIPALLLVRSRTASKTPSSPI